jgi:membrane fusion protein (multidrug efflux system)
LQQDVSEEKARLRAAQTRAQLARKNLDRARALRGQKVISDTDFDDRKAAYDQAAAEVDTVRAIIEKKTIRAPFSGRLGIRQVDVGEVLEPGQAIVSLQSMDPIFVNFQLPQQELDQLKPGLAVRVSTNAESRTAAEGTITAVNPEVDNVTRNVRVQATLDNPDEQLRPGMYVRVAVVLPAKRTVLTIPVTAVSHAPYSDSVFVVEPKTSQAGEQQSVLRQQFVKLGEKRGDYIDVRKGLEPGQTVVSTGVFKLRNGMAVVVDNTLAPDFELTPRPDNA